MDTRNDPIGAMSGNVWARRGQSRLLNHLAPFGSMCGCVCKTRKRNAIHFRAALCCELGEGALAWFKNWRFGVARPDVLGRACGPDCTPFASVLGACHPK